jgi:1-acyl-sn-glycerol-3-phosphate acyltransferase
VAVAYTRLHGLPLGRFHQYYAAWPGDVPLVPHLLTFVLNGAFDVEVIFGEASTFTADIGRKQIAAEMHQRVRVAYAEAMRMRERA